MKKTLIYIGITAVIIGTIWLGSLIINGLAKIPDGSEWLASALRGQRM